MEPGFHSSLPMQAYLDEPAFSVGNVQTLLERCPAAAWYDSYLNRGRERGESTKEQDVGSVVHALVLEGRADIIVPVDAADWRTKAAKEARDAARAEKKIALLAHQLPKVTAMVAANQAYIESLRTTEPAIWTAFQQGCGESEVVVVWRDKTGVNCRARPDRMSTDRRVIVDLKTVGGATGSAEPNTWGRKALVGMGFYLSEAFYRRGVETLTGEAPVYVFLVQEQEPPYLCSLVMPDPTGRALGDRRIARGLDRLAECVRRNSWPAYPPRVAHYEFPVFELAKEEVEEGGGIPYDIEKAGWPEARASAERLPAGLPFPN
jgi:hypothetical protein